MVSVRVPATSANLGPGFDCLGLALDLYARFDFELLPRGLEITGCREEDAGEDNLVYLAYVHTLKAFGIACGGLRLHIDSYIPLSRGLGSSAACVVGGILGAAALHGLSLSDGEALKLAAEMEGHPDNAAPAIYGGLRVSLTEDGQAVSLPCAVHPGLRFLALVPDFELRTADARAALPQSVPMKDAVYNLSHTAFLLKALEGGDPEMIRLAMRDRLHQDARFKLIPGAAALKELMERMGAAACCLSGAGPTMLCLYKGDDFLIKAMEAVKAAFPRFAPRPLSLCREGAHIIGPRQS